MNLAEIFFRMDPPPSLKSIQNMVARYNESLQCPPDVTNNLQLLNNKYGLNNIEYVCLKVLGCHHASHVNSEHVEGFGMTVGGFSFRPLRNMINQSNQMFMIGQ